MLTIGQLANYAGVTVRAVRHYHKIGLLPEPERDPSGYRRYEASAVVQLIRIRTLAEAGVPLSRVQQLLNAEPEDFDRGIEAIDKQMQEEMRRLRRHRSRIARLGAGEQLALPASVVGNLGRLRNLGIDERYIAMERDGWIMLAAQLPPQQLDTVIADKHRELDNPEMLRLYRLLSGALDWTPDDPRVTQMADVLEALMIRAVETGETGDHGLDDGFVNLLDTTTANSSPVADRLLKILQQRGWKGWTRIERIPTKS